MNEWHSTLLPRIDEQENPMEYEIKHNQDKISNLNILIPLMSNSLLVA